MLNKRVNINKSAWGIIDFISDFSILLLFVCLTTFGSSEEGANYLYYFSFILFIVISTIKLLAKTNRNGKIFFSIHTIWYLLFIALGIVSALWSYNIAYTFNPIQRMVQILLITFCLQIYVENEKDFERLLDLLIIACTIMTAYIFIKTPFEEWSVGFLGQVTGYNTNAIGAFASICAMIASYKGLILKKRAYLLLTVAFVMLCILTSSRKALFFAIFGIFLLVLFDTKKSNYFIKLMIVFGLLVVVLFLILNIPFLYEAIGRRLVSMEVFFKDDVSADSSLALREYFRYMAKRFYIENPVKGIGLNNFSAYLLQYSEKSSYSHNNFTEIASGLGTIGLLVYYWFYAYLLIKLLNQMLKGQRLAILFFPMICLIIIFEYAMVNYYSSVIQIIIVATYIAVCLNDTKIKKKSK